ncbi:PAS domain S-box protein [Desertifilum sp. FACHB-1129]|uniref:histidine kinase n=3 Tax=Cyanophyceae TaxID=3028117 RepID=A0A1E5QMC6_9CYAN|nr:MULTISPECIES: ATP-binding protein [Desertifilum]MDA0210515.1 ATP-binding protein [Cyanobacteria bacterium FC1]MDK3160157.1 ATP-binding protein [Kamptonema cortianum]MBD2311515.1 PAS domain S-box protein [Desertifilum sp. FACHB-1129]MBD2323089.1 PAS domain S-box protein [Desertifilum sp. FACHB-866]MBD2332934.1 PAS domain S-box protein [Desertifilum sp. FACHB-868]
MYTEQFSNQLRKAQNRLQKMQKEAENSSQLNEQLVQEAFGELPNVIEELHVAIEELHQQNEELVEARIAIERERQRYQELFDFAPDPYLVTTIQGRIVEANYSAEKLFNVRRKNLCGKPLSIFIDREGHHDFYLKLVKLKSSPSEADAGNRQVVLQDWETIIKPRNQSSFPATISVSSIYDSQKQLLGWRWLIRDITQRKQAEATNRMLQEAREVNSLKSRILRTVSHEFRTPMNVIYISIQLLERYSNIQNESTNKLFLKMRKAIDHMVNLLEDIMTFSQAEAGKLECNPSMIEVVPFCQNLIDEMSLDNSTKKIVLVEKNQLATGYWDAKLLRQILGNLLSNALKYSPLHSEIILELERQGDRALFHIQDCGIGIPPEDGDRLFEVFYRAGNVGTIPGTGLGLSIVQKAIELQGGAIAFSSEVGVGTTFSVSLPLRSR